MKTLTPCLKSTLIFISEYMQREGFAPTISEIAVSPEPPISRVSAYERVTRLKGLGLITTMPHRARGIRIATKGRHVLTDRISGIAEFVIEYCKSRNVFDEQTINEAFEAFNKENNYDSSSIQQDITTPGR